MKQGTKIVISGRIQTGSYINRDGVKVYTTDIVVEEQDFAESKAASEKNTGEYQQDRGYRPEPQAAPANYMKDYGYGQPSMPADNNGFMTIPDNIGEELPFI